MFLNILKDIFRRDMHIKILTVVVIVLGMTVVSGMIMLSRDVKEKLNRELKSFGSNIRVLPESRYLPARFDGVDFGNSAEKSYISEEDISRIKLIFWGYNITALAPFLDTEARVRGQSRILTGTWFQKKMYLESGETPTLGVKELKQWWSVDGRFPSDTPGKNSPPEALLGHRIAQSLGLRKNDTFRVRIKGKSHTARVAGVLKNRGASDDKIYLPLAAVQKWSGRPGMVERVDLAALTVPENALSRKASEDPESLTSDEFDIWYCTSYLSSILYQIEESIPGVVGTEIRQVSKGEGLFMRKMRILMILLSLAAILCSLIGVSETVTSSVERRAKEIALMRALGAEWKKIRLLFLAENGILAVIGGLIGFGAGFIVAGFIEYKIFRLHMDFSLKILPISILIAFLTVLLGAFGPLKAVLKKDPVEALHS